MGNFRNCDGHSTTVKPEEAVQVAVQPFSRVSRSFCALTLFANAMDTCEKLMGRLTAENDAVMGGSRRRGGGGS